MCAQTSTGWSPRAISWCPRAGGQNDNQIDITKRYLITEANISQTTKKLMEKDLIEKKMDPENNSKNLLYLTEKGQNRCDELLVLFRDWNNKVIKGIPMEDLILFGETLAMINENCLKMA